MPTGATTPAPPPARQHDDGGALAFFLLLFTMLALTFWWALVRQGRWLQQVIANTVEALKHDLPPLFLGEYLTRVEFMDYRDRLERFETHSRYLQERMDSLARRLAAHEREDTP